MKKIRKLINQHPIISVSMPFIVLGVFFFVPYLLTTLDTSNNQATISTSSPEPSEEGLSDEEYVGIAKGLYTAKQAGTIDQELKVIEDKYGYPAPTSFIDGDFDPDFLDYFERNTYSFWNPLKMDKSNFSFIIFDEKNKAGEFSIVAWPHIEAWHLIGKADRLALLVSAEGEGNGDAGPILKFKATPQSEPFKYELTQPITAIYPLDFYDYDGDSKNEISLRYTVIGADGFWQELVIFKVNGEKLEVLKRFPDGDRSAEGLARRVGNTIEMGGAYGDDGHLGYDKYLIEKYQYKNGNFVKISEQTLPHILLSNKWQQYLLK